MFLFINLIILVLDHGFKTSLPFVSHSFKHVVVHTFKTTTRRLIDDVNTLSIEPSPESKQEAAMDDCLVAWRWCLGVRGVIYFSIGFITIHMLMR